MEHDWILLKGNPNVARTEVSFLLKFVLTMIG